MGLLSCGIVLLGSFTTSVFAQTPDSGTVSTPASTTSATAADLQISPRFGAGYNTSGAGFNGYGRIEGFVPLTQTPGKNLFFLEGKLLLDNDSNLGSNWMLGYRALNNGSNNIFGGYVGFDTRNTGKSSFNQLGFGLELLSQNWDLRLNSYIPVGTTRNQVGEENRTEISAPYFQTNYLLADRTVTNTRSYQAAMTGVDLMMGTKLANLGSTGDLRGAGGLYYYSAAGSESTLGFKLGLTARPNDSLNFGVGVQSDGIFGTNLLFSIGASFPSSHPRGVAKNSVLARMGESVERVNTIAVRNQTETTRTITIGEKLTNPTTGQPYYFYHVALGNGSNGNGTFESPYNSLQQALDATQSNGNEIVYVQGNQQVAPFTIPDAVQVRSTGPLQQLVTVQIPLATLPLSKSGQYPLIDGGNGTQVTMGHNTLLGGFRLVNADEHAVSAEGVQNVTIQDNIIEESGGEGINLENVTGNVRIERNQILASYDQGIDITNDTGTLNLVIANNTIADGSDNGISLISENNAVQKATLTGNRIRNNSEFGIYIESYDTSQIIAIFDQENIFTGNSNYAILGESYGNSVMNVTINNNRIGPNNDEGMDFFSYEESQQDLVITNNYIDNNEDYGIYVESYDDSRQTVEIDNNRSISGNGSSGIWIGAYDNSDQEVTITNNLANQDQEGGIQGNKEDGIEIYAEDNALQEVTISRNTIGGNSSRGISVYVDEDAKQAITIRENNITENSGNGIEIETEGGNSYISFTIENNRITNNSFNGLSLSFQDNSDGEGDVKFNIFEGNGDKDVVGEFDSSQAVCLNLVGNSSNSGTNTGYDFSITGANLELVGGLAVANASNTPNSSILATPGKVDDFCTP